MAEGDPPAPPLPPLPPGSKSRSKSSSSITHISSLSPLPDDASFQPGTYVVQVPKEQILRIPPSENAYIAEQHRRKMHDGRQRCPSLLLLISILLIIIIILGLAVGILFVIVRPRIPSFVVESLFTKKLHEKASREYDLKLRSHNPSLKMGYCYEAGGNVAISDKGKVIATGRTPGFCQAPTSSGLFMLKTEGSNANLSKKTSQLFLLIQFPVRLKVWGIQVLARSLEISCEIRVSGSASTNKTRIVSQDCRAKMH